MFQIVAFLREAKIPTFPMRPYLEGSTPTDLEREANREGEEGEVLEEQEEQRARAAAEAIQQGDRWHHTYLYLTNINEAERDKVWSRPLLY